MPSTKTIHRRTILRSAAALLPLPMLEIMADESKPGQTSVAPRLAAMYMPFGVAMNHWTPTSTGNDYEMTPTLKSLTPFRQDLSIISGLQHIRGQDGGHRGVDLWLTGAKLSGPNGDYQNVQSFDQVAADHIGQTYLSSLVLSSMAGTGNPYNSHTLSFNRLGAPLPALSKPAAIFARLFPPHGKTARKDLLERFARQRSILDSVSKDVPQLTQKLGRNDRRVLNAYFESIREVERKVQTRQNILSQPPRALPQGSETPPADQMPTMSAWTEAMLDMIILALQTDQTRVATFATGVDDATNGGSLLTWPDLQEILKINGARDRHHIAHQGTNGAKKGLDGTIAQSQIDAFWTRHFAYMIKRLQNIETGRGSLLDHTMLLFGSSQSGTHDMTNMPIILAGGKALGLKHGSHLKYQQGKVPLSNLYLTMLQRAGVPVDRFGEGTTILKELV